MTYNEALTFCSDQSDLMYSPSLIQDNPLQLYSFLAQIGQFTSRNVWIGRPNSNLNSCVQIDPRLNRLQDVDCLQQNIPLCQKSSGWTIGDTIKKITTNQNAIDALTSKLTLQKLNVSDSIVALRNDLIPIGFIYIEYRNQSSPSTLWPTMNWVDITSDFAGQFFRALGGNSSAWDEVQQPCAPKIARVGSTGGNAEVLDSWFNHPVKKIHTGKYESPGTGTRFFIEGCEVRPINTAVRIWKRVE